jgi:SAM-dependent methyltransferase
MRVRSRRPDWKSWLESWDEQQESFNPERERRFSAMFDALEASVGRRFVALDLGSGPGSLSARLLNRFPRASCVAVDYDPVTLRVGREALGALAARLDWVDVKLGAPGWTDAIPRRRYDAALSTTALHWLRQPDLARLFRDLARLLRPGGVFLNGDHLPWGSARPGLRRLAERVRKIRFRGRTLDSEWAAWRDWWRNAERDPALREEFAAHVARSAQHPRGGDVPYDVHVRLLEQSGFRDVETIWQDMGNRVLYARKGSPSKKPR